jgi:hypothetical protein
MERDAKARVIVAAQVIVKLALITLLAGEATVAATAVAMIAAVVIVVKAGINKRLKLSLFDFRYNYTEITLSQL